MSTHLLDEELYIEDGYIDTSYFGGLIDGQIQATGYFEDDYIDQSYYSLEGMQFSLTASLTPSVVEGSATLSSAFGITASVENVLYGSANISCATSLSTSETYLVSLPATNLPVALSSAFAVSVDAQRTRLDDASITTNATISVDIVRIRNSSSTLQTESTVISTASRTRSIEANVSSNATVSATPYRIIQAGADIDSAMSSTLTVTVFKNHNAAMDSAFTHSADVNFTSDTSGLLEYFADLDAQAARTRGIDAGLNSEFFTSNNSGNLSNDIDASVIVDAASILTVSSSLSASVVSVELAQADITAEFDLYANALQYTTRRNSAVAGQRPHYPSTIAGALINTFTYKFGDGSLNTDVSNLDIQNRYLEYTMTDDDLDKPSSAGDAMVIEFFARGSPRIETWTSDRSTDPDHDERGWIIYAQTNINTIFMFATSDTGDSSSDNRINASVTLGTAWNHYVFRMDRKAGGDDWSIWINGSRAATTNLNNQTIAIGKSTDTMYLTFGSNEDYSSGPYSARNSYVDEFRILKGTSSEIDTIMGFDHSDTSYTVPSSIHTNNLNTRILLHADSDYGFWDDDVGIQLFESNQTSEFAFTATPQKIVSISSNLAATTNISSVIGRIKQTNIDLDATGSQLAAIGVIGSFFVNADVAANISTDANRFRSVDADVSSVVSATINAGKITDTSANFTGAFAPTLTVNVIRNDEADFTTTTTLAATPTRVRPGASNIDTAVSITANGSSIVDINSVLTSAFTQDTDYIRYRDASVDLDATGSQLVAIAKIAGFSVNADISANLSATGVVKTGALVDDIILSTLLNADVNLFKGVDIDLDSASNATATGVLVTGASAVITSAFSTTTDAARTRSIETNFDSIATQLSAIGKIMPYTAGLDSAFAITATPVKTTDVDANIEFVASITPLITRAKPLAADLTSTTALTSTLNKTTTFSSSITGTATLTATGAIKVFNLEQYYYTIPAETRSHTIAGETRSYSITAENRTYTIEGT